MEDTGMTPKLREALTIDLTGISDETALINSLISQFGFPGLYAKSWFSLREHLYYDSMLRTPRILNIKGFVDLKNRHPELAKKLQACFDEYLEGKPDRLVRYA